MTIIMHDANPPEVPYMQQRSALDNLLAQSGRETLDISQQYVRKEIAFQLLKDIDNYAVEKYDDGFRNHLGASLIGADCTRQTWYSWRWMARGAKDGRMQRLFQRGHLEELRFIEYLQGIGATVWAVNPETGKQFRVDRLDGHFGGSLDAIIKLPPHYHCPDLLFLGEFKTKSTKTFEKLKKQGIMLNNPQHYDQMSTYGANYGYQYAVYFSVNKNDDDLHIEVVPLNWQRAAEVEQKAAYIIQQQTPPPRIAENPTFWKCKGCDFHGVCFDGHIPAKNCRSCQYATPAAGGTWYCHGHKATIPDNVLRVGCDQWTYIR